MFKKPKICVIGLGYVGLPLAISLSKYFSVTGFDTNPQRVLDLKSGNDITKEIKNNILKKSKINYTYSEKKLFHCNIFIVTVPTPVNSFNSPDLSNIISATKIAAKNLSNKSLIIYESTVYPGCTEEMLIPIIQKVSKKKLNKDFFVGYSPERIDPGLSKYKLNNQVKIISGSNSKSLKIMRNIYSKIINKKLYETKDIKTAEAAKIIENTQRDINIAFVNELSMLFHKLNINTKEVLSAAKTKWNFLDFKPGLVGGHCIGVDPYYLKFKAIKSGLKPKMISSGREINDSIPYFIFKEVTKIFKSKFKSKKKINILFMGVTFKEDCNDIRNSKSLNLYKLLKRQKKINIDIYDPIVDKKILFKNYKIRIQEKFKKRYYDAIIIAVPHKVIKKFSINYLKSLGNKKLVIIDLKSIFPKELVQWQL